MSKIWGAVQRNLRRWIRLWEASDGATEAIRRKPRYSDVQKRVAVEHYLNHGCCLAFTSRTLGYPCCDVLARWVNERHPDRRLIFTSTINQNAPFEPELKRQVVMALCTRHVPATDHCPECDEPLHHIRDAVSEKLEYIPAHFVVNRYVRPQYSCLCCQKVFSGEMPTHILPKSAVEPSVIAQVVINKYSDHLPLYRQNNIFARSDIELPVSTMSDMVGVAGAALTPLADMLHSKILERSVIHSDETSLCILDTKKGGKSRKGSLWAYVSGEKSGPPLVYFDCRTGHSHENPKEWLRGWRGWLVVDGNKVYNTLAERVEGINLAGCWAHTRRGFMDAWQIAKEPRGNIAVEKIARLYQLEEKIKHRPVKKIQQWRKRYAKPLLDELWLWMEKHKDATPPGSLFSKAINYALSRRVQLSRFLEDGALPLDNNACERAIRPVVMGRKSWLFAGSLMAGERAVQIMSLLETAKRNGLEPHAWLTDVLKRLPCWPEERLEELLPLRGFTFTE
ncbi:TPA: IS66 family transposase [Salmonella enterica subsp. enterica serovar Muenchen]